MSSFAAPPTTWTLGPPQHSPPRDSSSTEQPHSTSSRPPVDGEDGSSRRADPREDPTGGREDLVLLDHTFIVPEDESGSYRPGDHIDLEPGAVEGGNDVPVQLRFFPVGQAWTLNQAKGYLRRERTTTTSVAAELNILDQTYEDHLVDVKAWFSVQINHAKPTTRIPYQWWGYDGRPLDDLPQEGGVFLAGKCAVRLVICAGRENQPPTPEGGG